MKEQVMRKTVLTASVEVTGVVTFTDGLHVEITVGQPPKPEAKVYCDGNPLNLMTGEKVLVNLRIAGIAGYSGFSTCSVPVIWHSPTPIPPKLALKLAAILERTESHCRCRVVRRSAEGESVVRFLQS